MDEKRIESDADCLVAMMWIVERLYYTPSMVDKLPKYLMEEIHRVMEYRRRTDGKG